MVCQWPAHVVPCLQPSMEWHASIWQEGFMMHMLLPAHTPAAFFQKASFHIHSSVSIHECKSLTRTMVQPHG